ncbi:hypothetical protein [Paracoccus sp. IB05]|uniref:NYN domain-containing protein n=1 Tax=Paracoccus sp. IB05 TaxID=2779367 RepID=UPI0018E71BAF|nr:hypothetical protein [Paracoccus sp. IB05]MBJ2152529.1 hypothetical protein [Paracoccus sp. IB05]
MVELSLAVLLPLLLLAWLLALALGLRRRWRARAKARRPLAVLDGSNVMHWRDGRPQIATLSEVLGRLDLMGYGCGVVFDANAGYLLTGRYMNDRQFCQLLGLEQDHVLVVPRGAQADPFLLDFANQSAAVIISNDRFRDRIAGYPDLARPGRLVRGGYRDNVLWLDLAPAGQAARKQGARKSVA